MGAINKINVNGITYDILGLPVGTIFTSVLPQTNSGVHLLDGSYVTTNGIYSDFCKLVKDLSIDYSLLCSEKEYQDALDLTGSCGRFVLDEENNTLRLPTITTFIQGLTDLTNIGNTVEAGLPNIEGTIGGTMKFYNVYNSGSFYWDESNKTDNEGDGATSGQVKFDASRSSNIYGNSETVQPPSVTYPYYIVLATVKQTDIEVNIDNVVNDLNQLSNQVINIENSLLTKIKRYVTETWQSSDGLSWYTLYSDGWKECGGTILTVTQDSVNTLALPITFSNTNYICLIQAIGGKRSSTQYTNGQTVVTKNLDNIQIRIDDYTFGRMWRAEGY